MNGTTHTIGGISAGFLAASVLYGAGTIVSVSVTKNTIDPTIHFQSLSNMCLLGGTFGGIWCDIDKKNTKASNKMPILSFFIRLWTKHRQHLHAPLYNAFLCYGTMFLMTIFVPWMDYIFQTTTNEIVIKLLFLWNALLKSVTFITGCANPLLSVKPFFIGMLFGTFSHILLDMITTEGVPIFWPISNEKISIANLNGKEHGPMVSTIILSSLVVAIYFGVV